MDMCANFSDNHTCMNCSIKKLSLIGNLDLNELTEIESERYQLSYKAGDYIFRHGSMPIGLIALHKGKVKITQKGILDQELIVDLKKPVDFLGFNALIEDKPHLNNAIALEDTTICIIKKDSFFKTLHNNNEFSFKVIKHLIKELNQSQFRMINLTQKHMRARMAEALLLVLDIFGNSPTESILNISMKRSDYAALANMTTANSIRILSAFNKEKLIHLDKRNITILQKEKLVKICTLG